MRIWLPLVSAQLLTALLNYKNMANLVPKKIHNPIPPEYANVFILKMITAIVGIICLLLSAYATWVVYTMSNRIALYENPLGVETVMRKVAPLDFSLFEQVMSIDEKKRTFTLPPLTRDAFYNRSITSTENIAISTSSTQSSDSVSPSSTQL